MVERRAPENLPDSPGVYLFRGDKGKLLYVGKARSLRKRIATYFGAGEDADLKTGALLRQFSDIETIVTNTELEALLLENTLIKKHRPRYNVCLRDDKTYPYVKITTGEPWPRALITRRVQEDGHSYFGPFWGGLARRIMRMITRHFQIRTCTLEIDGNLPRPCLYYDLHACLGPCVAGLTTKEAYDAAVADVVLFLEGRNQELQGSLERKMLSASEEQDFEMAAAYRDALRTVRDVAERQVVQSMKGENVDVFGFFESGQDVAVVVLVVRGGALQDRRDFFFEKAQELDAGALPGGVPAPVLRREPVPAGRDPPAGRHLRPPPARGVPGRAARREGGGQGSAARSGRGSSASGGAQRERASPRPLPPHRRRGGAGRRAAVPGHRPGDPAAPHRGLRHLAPAGDRQRRVDGGLRGRQTQEVRLPALQHRVAGAPGAGRLPEHGRGRRPALPTRPGRRRPVAGPDPRGRRTRTAPGGADRARSPRASSCPIVGLAKREEEIWVPDRPEPIRLSRKDPALQLDPARPRRGAPLRDHAPPRAAREADARRPD